MRGMEENWAVVMDAVQGSGTLGLFVIKGLPSTNAFYLCGLLKTFMHFQIQCNPETI